MFYEFGPRSLKPAAGSKWSPVIYRLKACLRSTSHHLDSSDLPRHENSSNWYPTGGKHRSFWRQSAI